MHDVEWENENPFRKIARFIVGSYYLGFIVSLVLYVGAYLGLMVFSEDFRANHDNFAWIMGSIMVLLWPLGLLFLLLYVGLFFYFAFCRIF